MLTMCAVGNRKGAGIGLMAGVVTAMADAWICSRFEEGGKAVSGLSFLN